ncbi:MAG TPA: helix-turn-helix domain-containing protein [Oligoflexus sp.]|uniref:helix-turn-helix domain-containing protein n=1 Tax=Oligoflexus sp. TaxID=1971216 RepID=UPI002D7FBD68|nr:helix-turn-helix domain-containing protein [Oligoflexus sp.]HET9238403.1 helix-turn-helix domain-containing protein [Oligoflexus sp.]
MTKIDNEQAESNKPLEGKAPVDERPFGAMLRAAREQSGFTIERAAMATRISPPFVEALEQGNFAQLPGAVFGRGFIRNLCKVYGVDSAEILAAFDRSINPPSPGKGKDVISPSVRDEKRHQQLKKGVLLIQPNEWKGRIKALAPHHYLRAKPLILLVAALVVGAIIINQIDIATRDSASELAQTQERSETPAVPAATAPSADVTPAPAAAPETTAAVSTPVAPAVADNTPAPAAAPAPADQEDTLEGGTLVQLTVKEPVTVKITRDNDKQITGQLKPDTYRYRFKDQLKFYVDDSSVVEIYFKGQRVPTSTVKGEPKRITFQSAESAIAKKAVPGTSLR